MEQISLKLVEKYLSVDCDLNIYEKTVRRQLSFTGKKEEYFPQKNS